MPLQVCTGAKMMCTCGSTPAVFTATVAAPQPVQTSNKLAGTIMDCVPMTNIPTFGICISPTNPQVIAATSAAMGVFTPQPCVPATVPTWKPGAPNVLIANIPALDNVSTLNCMWAGVITFVDAGQVTHQIP